jgi:hypothetical protein
MINSIEDLRSGGELPTGPVSAWPRERNEGDHGLKDRIVKPKEQKHDTEVKASPGQMISGLIQTAGQALTHGKVSEEIREERYDTCKACPHFIEDSKRCSECGCFMEAKTWVSGEPGLLCPKKKWKR